GDKTGCSSVQIDGQGRAVLAGRRLAGSNWDLAVARLTRGGHPDTTFGGDGYDSHGFGANESAHGLALDGNGRLDVVGESSDAAVPVRDGPARAVGAAARELPTEALGDELSDLGRARADPDAGGFERRLLRLGRSGRARDDRAGVAHGLSGGSREAGDVGEHR